MNTIQHSLYRDQIRRKLLFFLSLFLFPSITAADNWKNLGQGDQAAQEFLNNVEKKKAEAGSHPFSRDVSKEAKLKDGNLTQSSQALSQTDLASQMIRESLDSRPQIKIDLTHDPLMVTAQKIMANPLGKIGEKGTHAAEISQVGKDELIQCEEAGEDSLESCVSNLSVKVVWTKVRREWRGQIRLLDCYFQGLADSHHRDLPAYYSRTSYCQALKTPLLFAERNITYYPERIPQSHNITRAYIACVREVTNPAFPNRCHCNFCSRHQGFSLPLGIPAEKIINVTIESNLRQKGWFTEETFILWSGRVDVKEPTSESSNMSEYVFSPIIKITYEENTYRILPDEWASTCGRLEERVDQGLCHYVSKVCTQGPQTRIIEGVPITRNCWQETFTYACDYPAKNDCSPLRARGCAQINAACKRYVGRVCVVYSQTYQCKGWNRTSYQIHGGKTPFCLDGNCRDQSWENNDEMMSTLAQLSILKELQGQFQSGVLFKGEDNRCSKQPIGFKDCCGSGKGWGNDLGLSSCSAREKALSQKRKKGLCHYVGTYCAKKVLGQCVKKKSSYCCFTNKLLKAFHEQGRPQISLGWGSGKEPLCRGFTIEEIQRIDFSKLDLREVFEDLMKNYAPGKTQNMGQKVNERLEIIKQGLIPKATQQPRQRSEG